MNNAGCDTELTFRYIAGREITAFPNFTNLCNLYQGLLHFNRLK